MNRFEKFRRWVVSTKKIVPVEDVDFTNYRYFVVGSIIYGPFTDADIPEEYRAILADRDLGNGGNDSNPETM